MSSKEITLSPFYHSAVNAVTRPNKFTAVSDYFIDRWMPLLGGNGVLIVLALRRGGFLNQKTGECRDEIVIDRETLAKAAGISDDTLTRELGTNRKTGKPQNEWLHMFVQKRNRKKRNHLGQIRQDESVYWVAMDDPIHPDDWQKVQEAVRQAEERLEKANQPEPHTTVPVDARQPQIAAPEPQSAGNQPQITAEIPQSAAHLKSLDSSSPKITLMTAAPPGDSLSLFGETERPKPQARTVSQLEAQWKALPDGEKDRYRPAALVRCRQDKYDVDNERLVLSTMMHLYIKEQKATKEAGVTS